MVSERISKITPSATLEMSAKAAKMREQGISIVSLNAGEPDFGTPQNIKNACTKALEEEKTKYASVSGVKELKQAISDKLARDNGLYYSDDEIIVCTGAKQAIYNAMMAVCDPGDEVILPIPCWVSYEEIIRLTGAEPVLVETAADYQLDINAIEKSITDKTKAVIICTPNNPTGAVYSRESLEKLLALAVGYGFYVVSDEIYEKLIYGDSAHFSIGSLPGGKEHTIVINGFSKAYSMTGWRLGYAAGPADVIRGMASLQGHSTGNAATFVQWAAVAALTGDTGSVEAMKKEFEKRRNYVISFINSVPGMKCPEVNGAFYVLTDVSAYFGRKTADGRVIANADDFCEYLLSEAHTACVSGTAFRAPECIRISYASSMENIVKGMEALKNAAALLR